MRRKVLLLIISLIIPQLVGIISTIFTIDAIRSWYIYLQKPFFSPPNFIFGPVWTTLYLMMGISQYLVLTSKKRKQKDTTYGLAYYAIQLALNFLWSYIFFGLRQPLYAFIEILFLWVFIALTISRFIKINKTAGYLLIPYLLWVSFASILNLSIVLLN